MASIPASMKALVLSKPGGVENFIYSESYPTPQLVEGQILVQNNFAGINYVDIYFRRGDFPPSTGYPLILGQEGAGVVAAIKGANPYGFEIGDRVVWLGDHAFAEFAAVPASRAIRIPPGVSDEDAVGGHLTGMTALALVEEAFPVQKGQVVLVHAASGGVGLLLCQILRDKGAIVIGTAGGSKKCALAVEYGATHMIDYKLGSGPTWVEQVMQLTKGEGVSVVYDSVGKDTWEGSIKVVKPKGKVVFYGTASGPVPPLDLDKLRERNVSVMTSTVGNNISTRAELQYYASSVLRLSDEMKLKIKVHKVYNLNEVVHAQEDLEGRNTTGKLLVRL